MFNPIGHFMRAIKFFLTLNIAAMLFSALMILIAVFGTFGPVRFGQLSSTIAQSGFGVAIFTLFWATIFFIIFSIMKASGEKKNLTAPKLGLGLTIFAFFLAAVNQGFFFFLLLTFPANSLG